jgi:hypothetical protein
MATKGEYEYAGFDLELQGFDAVDESISTIQKAVGLNHEAIRELGCRIVAQALERNGGSTVGFE